MPDFEDYYEILGVGSKATPDEITKAWKDKFWILSPDRMIGAPETAKKRAEEELKKVNNAYDTLKDPQKRQDYDKQWHQIKDKPKPVVDPPNIQFNNVNPKEVKTGSFVIRNLGGPYNKINISNPNTWVKVVRWHSLTSTDELPLQVDIEAIGEDFGKNYTEQIKVDLDDEETYVRIELQTRPPAGASRRSIKRNNAKGLLIFVGLLAVIIIALGAVFLNYDELHSKSQLVAKETSTTSSLTATVPGYIMAASTTIASTTYVTPAPVTNQTWGKVVATVAVGYGSVAVAVNSSTNMVYVVNSTDGTVSVINGTSQKVIATLNVETSPTTLAVNPITNQIYVVNTTSSWQGGSGTVSVIDGNKNSVVATINVGYTPAGIAINTITNLIYVANAHDNNVSVIDGSTNKIVATVTVGTFPIAVAVNPSTNLVYVSNAIDASISVIDGSTNKIVTTFTVNKIASDKGIVVNPNLNLIYQVNQQGTLSVIDGKTNSIVATVNIMAIPTNVSIPLSLAADLKTGFIYVTNGNGLITVIYGTTNSIVSTVNVGGSTEDVAVNPTTGLIYIAGWNPNDESGKLSIIQP